MLPHVFSVSETFVYKMAQDQQTASICRGQAHNWATMRARLLQDMLPEHGLEHKRPNFRILELNSMLGFLALGPHVPCRVLQALRPWTGTFLLDCWTILLKSPAQCAPSEHTVKLFLCPLYTYPQAAFCSIAAM